MSQGRLILGITGTNGAGKGTVVDYLLKNKDFSHFSASGLITEEILKLNLPITRGSMIEVGNKLRAEKGAGYIVEELLRRTKEAEGKNVVIESIRTLAEVDKLAENGGILIAVDADPKLRYERNEKRGSVKDGISFEKFIEFEQQEKESTDPYKQNLSACRARANYVILNNGTLEELNEEIEKMLKIISVHE